MTMRANYAEIAPIYDDNPGRHDRSKEELIGWYFTSPKRPARGRILDLACGTGIFLAVQMRHYARLRAEWHGLDRSAEMLARAAEKNPRARLSVGVADRLPYEDRSFDFVFCNYAFHHFEKKRRSIEEISRILKPGGYFVMTNVAPEYMASDSWIYRFFPEARKIDAARFWSTDRLYREVSSHLRVREMTTHVAKRMYEYDRLLSLTSRRDMSSLSLLSEKSYLAGRARMARASRRSRSLLGAVAVMRLVAAKE